VFVSTLLPFQLSHSFYDITPLKDMQLVREFQASSAAQRRASRRVSHALAILSPVGTGVGHDDDEEKEEDDDDDDDMQSLRAFQASSRAKRRVSAFGADTTTTLSAVQITQQLKRALDLENVTYTEPTPFKLVCESRPAGAASGQQQTASPVPGSPQKALQRGVSSVGGGGGALQRRKTAVDLQIVRWEMEICELDRLDMRGIQLRRVVGDIWEYKKKVDAVMGLINNNAAKLKVA
jgi:hypothetical protein